MQLLGIMVGDVGPSFFTLLQPEMSTNDATTGRCDQPLDIYLHMYLHVFSLESIRSNLVYSPKILGWGFVALK